MCRVKWAVWNGGIYDLSDYFNTLSLLGSNEKNAFLDSSISDFFNQQPGQDISNNLNAALANMAPEKAAQNKACLQNVFYRGATDFRKTPRCVAPNIIPLAFSGIICVIIVAKCKRLRG